MSKFDPPIPYNPSPAEVDALEAAAVARHDRLRREAPPVAITFLTDEDPGPVYYAVDGFTIEPVTFHGCTGYTTGPALGQPEEAAGRKSGSRRENAKGGLTQPRSTPFPGLLWLVFGLPFLATSYLLGAVLAKLLASR